MREVLWTAIAPTNSEAIGRFKRPTRLNYVYRGDEGDAATVARGYGSVLRAGDSEHGKSRRCRVYAAWDGV